MFGKAPPKVRLIRERFPAPAQPGQADLNRPRPSKARWPQSHVDEFRRSYEQSRDKICRKLQKLFCAVTENARAKRRQVRESQAVYSQLQEFVGQMLRSTNQLLTKSKQEALRLTGASSGRDNPNLYRIDKRQMSTNRNSQVGSRQQQSARVVSTNTISVRFLDSVLSLVWLKRKYFFRLADYVHKICILNRVGAPASD